MDAKLVRLITNDQLVLQGIIYLPEKQTNKAYLHIHGMAGNFYENKFLDFMAEGLTGAGYAFLSINTRGHDMVADFVVAGPKEEYKRIGNSYEIFEECLHDIKAGIDFLASQYSEIVLCGHSLGCSKVAYYASIGDKRVNKLVLMSPSDMVGLFDGEKNHAELYKKAEDMISAGKGTDFLPVKIWDEYNLSAQTYVNFSTKDSPIDVFSTYEKSKVSPVLSGINIPTLAFFGGGDDGGILPQKEALEIIRSKAPNAPSFDLGIIEDAPHSYFGKEKEMVDKIIDWLQ